MPTYSYECGKCGHRFDVFHAMSASPKVKCESCGSVRCKKQLGTGSGFIFKGSGFYETDFKDKKGTPDKKIAVAPTEGKSESKTETKTEAKTETKTEAKTEAKPAPKAESKPAASKSARKPKA